MAYIQDWGMRVQAQPQINTTRRAFLHLSQNENGRMLNIRITDVDIPAGSTAVLAGTKPDGTVYSQTGTLAGNTATFAEDVQMTAVAGTWDAKITVTNGGNCICTARITITIDPDTVAGGAIPSDSQLDGIIAECRAIADSVRKEAYGSPLVADAVEDMTDQSRVYVYTGSESGMTAGHWYYYNGTAWSDGGVYNAVAVDTDTTLSVAGKAADGKATGDALNELKEDLKLFENNLFYQKEQLTSSEIIAANNNTAVTNNGDGTYSIGTNDNGNTTFGSGRLSLDAGYYLLYGVPNGIAFLSPEGAVSKSYNNRVFENISPEPKIIHITESTLLWVCYRVESKPSSEYVIAPSLIKLVPIVDSALKFKGVLESGTDLNTITERGIYFVSSDRTYTNAPLSSGFFIVLTTVTAVQQIFIQYGSALTYTDAVYKRDGGTSGVTTSWKRYGVLNNHNIVFFGDSIMWGRDGSVSTLTRSQWQIPHSVSWILGYRTVNYGVAGQAFLPTTDSPATAYDNIASKNLSAYDTLVMCYGIGDGFHILGEWDSTDETTVMGQFNKIINYIYTQNPTMRIIVIAPWNGRNIGTYPDYWYGDRDRSPYVSRKVLSDTLKRACDYYWIPYIEQYDGPITPNTITTLLPDGIHPNDDGYKMIGEWVAKKIGGLL